MKAQITHSRAVVGWNVNVVVNADAGEIAHVRVEVNDSPEDNEDVQPPAQ
jgi:hypothetical protein